MSTKVKAGIAAAIVAALVALIVLDQKTAPKDEASKAPAGSEPAILIHNAPAPDQAATRMRLEDTRTFIREAEEQLRGGRPAGPGANPRIEKVEPDNRGKVVPPAPADGDYVIKENDSFDRIAKERYGNSKYARLIAEANPSRKANALRPGDRLVLPLKPEEKAPAPEERKPAAEAVAAAAGAKTYTIQTGDTLSDISKKVYGTARHYEKIFEANRDRIDDPNMLVVGRTLAMPDLAGGGTVQTAAPAPQAGGRVHQVQTGDSLWKIAEKYAGEKGILDTLKAIVVANADKLKDGERTLLRLGWQIVVPE